jgi:hypothetical protein
MAFDMKDAVRLEVEVSGPVPCVGCISLLAVLHVKSHGRATGQCPACSGTQYYLTVNDPQSSETWFSMNNARLERLTGKVVIDDQFSIPDEECRASRPASWLHSLLSKLL